MANGKMCPLLTAGVIKSPPTDANGVQDATAGLDAMQCQGDVCAMWIRLADETGKLNGQGNCAIPLTAVALSQLNLNIGPKGPKLVKG